MSTETLQTALEREHRAIDRGIETFVAEAGDGGAESYTAAPLVEAIEALKRHIYLEEAFLFPPLREAGLTMPIFVMLREHGELWKTMDALTALLDEKADSQRLRDTCTEFLAQLDQHNSKEEPVIYPQATSLSEAATADLAEFIASGQTPYNWVCQHGRS
ncbi:MAG TPA: hemerythrin domain-containing protein [Streptomyces sp.]